MSAQLTITIPVWLDFIFTCPLLTYRLLRYGYVYRRIYLGEGKYTIVDPQDFYRLNIFRWCAVKQKSLFHAVRLINGSNDITKILSLHTEIMNPPKGLVVDHRNRDGLDNRRDNLRFATYSQNRCNTDRSKAGCSSQYRGVHWYKKGKCWKASIQFEGKWMWLGRFDSEIDAARAYDEAAKKYHREFTRLNFPETADR